jgi:hypothetical protein
MNREKSNFDPNHRPEDGVLRFERTEDGYLMLAEGVCDGKRVQEQPQNFILDGVERPVPGAPEYVAVATRPDPQTIRAIGRKGGQVVGDGSYVVSADGKTLTATVRGVDARQRPFQTVVVWERQAG